MSEWRHFEPIGKRTSLNFGKNVCTWSHGSLHWCTKECGWLPWKLEDSTNFNLGSESTVALFSVRKHVKFVRNGKGIQWIWLRFAALDLENLEKWKEKCLKSGRKSGKMWWLFWIWKGVILGCWSGCCVLRWWVKLWFVYLGLFTVVVDGFDHLAYLIVGLYGDLLSQYLFTWAVSCGNYLKAQRLMLWGNWRFGVLGF